MRASGVFAGSAIVGSGGRDDTGDLGPLAVHSEIVDMAKTFMGVVHLLATPSTCGGSVSIDALIAHALEDARRLAVGGCDALMIENFGDAPFRKGGITDPVAPDTVASLALAAREVRLATGLPVGVNCLRNDAIAGLGAGAVAGARYLRVNVLNGTMVTDQGLIEGEAARLRQYQLVLGYRPTVLADVLVKHATPMAVVDAVDVARDLVERSGADVLVVSGARTGGPVDPRRLESIRAALPSVPIWIGSGLDEKNAADLWPLCDGAIVGTSLKHDGIVQAAVDVNRVRSLRARLSP